MSTSTACNAQRLRPTGPHSRRRSRSRGAGSSSGSTCATVLNSTTGERRRAVAIERTVLALLDRLVVVAERDGDLPAAIGAASRRLDVDPLDEGAHVRLMELLSAAGDRSGALRQYRACVATLERELGVAPLATTTARYEAIRDGAGASPGAVDGGPTDTRA